MARELRQGGQMLASDPRMRLQRGGRWIVSSFGQQIPFATVPLGVSGNFVAFLGRFVFARFRGADS